MSADRRLIPSAIISEICLIHLIFRGITEMQAQPIFSSVMILFGVSLLLLNFQVAAMHVLWERDLAIDTGLRGFRGGQFNAVGSLYFPLYVSNMLHNDRPLPETGPTSLKHIEAGDVWRDDQNRLRIALSGGKSAIIEDAHNSVNRNGDEFRNEWIGFSNHGRIEGIRWPTITTTQIIPQIRSLFSVNFGMGPALRGADRTQIQIMQSPQPMTVDEEQQEQQEQQGEAEQEINEQDNNTQIEERAFLNAIDDLEI